MTIWIRGCLPACDPRDALVTIASELAANAVTHTRSGEADGHFTIDVMWCHETARVVVGDQGSKEVPEIAANAQAEIACAESGRGLLVVDKLSASWGVTGDADARWLWADVDWRRHGAPVLVMPGGDSDAGDELAKLSQAYPATLAWYDGQSHDWCALLPQPQGTTGAVTLRAPSPSALSHMVSSRYLAVS